MRVKMVKPLETNMIYSSKEVAESRGTEIEGLFFTILHSVQSSLTGFVRLQGTCWTRVDSHAE